MLKKWAILFFTTFFALVACHSPVYNQTEGNVADVKIKAAAARHRSDMTGRPSPSLVVKDGLYVDTTPINLERQPQWLRNHIVIRGDKLPFSYYSRLIGNGAGGNILTKYQSGLDPSFTVSISYSGSVKGALDLLAAKTGFNYVVHSNSVYWQAFVTKTFDIAFMPGGTDYLMGKASGGAGTANTSQGGSPGSASQVSNFVSSDESDSEFSNLKGQLSVWRDLEVTIKQLLSPEGKVTVSESTTSIIVRDKPTNVELVSQYVKNLNRNLSKQVLVKIQVLEVDLLNDYEFGINWQSIARAFNKSPFVVNANYGTPISIQSLTPQGNNFAGAAVAAPQFGIDQSQNPQSNGGPGALPSYTILFNALSQQGKTSVVSEPRVVCLNNQVSVVRIVKQEGYLASIQNTSLSGGTGSISQNTVTSQLTPGNLITGLTLYILPKILNNNIYMQVNADLSKNDGFGTFGPTNSQIQLPNITEKHFNQRSMIHSGDTLILSGFRQVTNQANANQFITSQALGGKASQQANAETIVLITPIILDGHA